MDRLLLLISIILIPFPGNSQSYDKKAMEHYNNGCKMISVKNYPGAISAFTEAIRLDSGFLQAWENRGVAKYYLADHRGAIADYNAALEINPDDYNTYGRRGWARFKIQDCRGAIDDFTKALEGTLDEAGYYNIRGRAKFELQDYQGAIEDFDRVIKSWSGGRDKRGEALYWRGMVKLDMGQKESACLDFDRAGRMGYEKALEVKEMIFCP